MYKDNKNQEETQNFWISYADLMAGLLFVFILLVGAIVIKYVFIQTDLQTIRTDLQKEKDALGLSESDLADKKKRLEKIQLKLKDARNKNFHLSFEITKLQGKLNSMSKALDLSELDKEKLNELIAKKIEIITMNANEIQKLKDLLFDYELKEKDLLSKNDTLQKELQNSNNTIILKNEELAMLENSLIIKSKEHQALVEELDIAKVKIKSLTGIKIRVISKLKEKLGKSIAIDKNSGAIRFSSNILFEQGKYKLKDSSKKELNRLLNSYIDTLLYDKDIKDNIEQIVIEGYTNSDGTYLYNLELSQKRALEVMKFLYSSNPKKSAIFRKYISASGRSYANPIMMENGEEDKDASRRIEIKFRIKNEKAINELKKFLSK